MNQGELITVLAKEHGFTKALAGRVLSTVLETIRAELIAGREVRIRNFGVFETRETYGRRHAKLDDSDNFFRPPGKPSPAGHRRQPPADAGAH